MRGVLAEYSHPLSGPSVARPSPAGLLILPVAERLARITARSRPALSRIEGLGDRGCVLCRGKALERKARACGSDGWGE